MSVFTSHVHSPDVTLLDYWRVVWKRRWLIGGLFVGLVLLVMVMSLLAPKIYEASTSILPPVAEPSGGGMGAAAALLGSQGMSISLPGMPATPVDLFVAMLKSKTLAEELVQRFNLMQVYKSKAEEDAVRTLESSTRITTSKEKVIRVTVEAQDPQLAADLANGYAEGLDKLNRTLAVTKAGQNRLFVGKRLAETKIDLAAAEDALAAFQSKNKTVALDQQAAAALRAAAEIQGRIAADEVRLQVMQNFLTPENPDVIKLTLEIQQLKQQLRMLESGNGGKGMAPGDRLHPAFSSVPTLGIEFARLTRDLKVQETLYAMLASQYEQAQLAEARDTPTVQVLDRAKPPLRKIRPSVRLNMMVAGATALFIGILVAFFLEYLDQINRRRLTPKVTGLSESVPADSLSEEETFEPVR
ncbi:MAG: hypothetical protein HZB35_07485 [Nitrospirae bacterium]|nr:hypothetical protein [Nitrospirota bacterium]